MKLLNSVMLLCIIPAICQSKEPALQFINNPGLFKTSGFYASADYIENYIYYEYMMEHHGEHVPAFTSQVRFDTQRLIMGGKRVYFEAVKVNVPRFFTPNTHEYQMTNFSYNSIKALFLIKTFQCTNLAFSVNTFDLLLGFNISKKFNNFYYSIGYQRYWMFFKFIHIPDTYSFAYSPFRNIWVYDEFLYHKNNGKFKTGYMNLCGIKYNYKCISLSAFYNILYDGNDIYAETLTGYGYDKYLQRFGFQIMLFYAN